jgi:hypothetical protein
MHPREFRRLACAACLFLAAAVQADVPSTTVQFPKGGSSATLKSQLKGPGNDARDFVVRAKGGQTMDVALDTASTSTYFNVLPPGSEEALFAGERMGGAKWSGKLPADGDYKVRVYLNRAAARQAQSASYTLKISVR